MLLLKGLLGSRSLKPTVGLVLSKPKRLVALKGLVTTEGVILSRVSSPKDIVYEDLATDHVYCLLFEFNIVLGNRSHEEFRQDIAR
jgi:hypothetical protein